MAYIWGVLAAVEPAFRTVTDSSDPWIRALMKVPGVTGRPGAGGADGRTPSARSRCWAVVAAAVVLLHPAIIDVSAWWGQYESDLPADRRWRALVFALERAQRAGRRGPGARGDDQAAGPAVPPAVRGLVLGARRVAGDRPDARRSGWRSSSSCGCRSSRPAGPATTCSNLAVYQNEIFPILSLQAWNIWWLVQSRGRRRVHDRPRRGPRADHAAPHRLRHHRPAVARRRGPDPARPAAADVHPGPRRVDPDLVRRS